MQITIFQVLAGFPGIRIYNRSEVVIVPDVIFHRCTGNHSDFRSEVLAGLSRKQKSIPPKFLYDSAGSHLFAEITSLDEYYLTRLEKDILARNRDAISEILRDTVTLVEFGGGDLSKAREFIDIVQGLEYYVVVDIAADFMLKNARKLSRIYPDLQIIAICSDFSRRLDLVDLPESGKRAFLFLGSSIGNFEPDQVIYFFRNCSNAMKSGDHLILGADAPKDAKILERAYNDSRGITAEFNLNLLRRINREMDANIDISNFSHRAIYNHEMKRIEMHLGSISFRSGEYIHTENSYKYNFKDVETFSSKAGLKVDSVFQDRNGFYSIYVIGK